MTQLGRAGSKTHLLTINLEDYYHLGAFNRLIQRGEWYRFEPRLEKNTHRTLDLLDACRQRATFFVLGWVADTMPELVAEIAARGHEVASKGYYHRSIKGMTPAEFAEDLVRARESLQQASGQRINGYRVADEWFGPADLWALDVLADQGYAYDSSIGPIGRRFAEEPWRRFAHTHQGATRSIWEFPISAVDWLGCMVPIAGGNWFRQLPPFLVRRAVARWHRTCPAPYVMYFHAWELDPDQPKISAASWLQRVRTYRNLSRMPERLHEYLSQYRFTSIADYLGLAAGPVASPLSRSAAVAVPSATRSEAGCPTIPVTVVVPCYNETSVLPYLANTLRSVLAETAHRYSLQFVFVDDQSSDDTWDLLQRLFGGWSGCRLLRHESNRGVAAAIATGLAAAETEIVVSIDCDCTYDPHRLLEMIPLLEADVDLVTASPYHPAGLVRNVPEWRLMLSRTLSRLYRLVLHHKLFTYTSCFRVYRRSSVASIAVHDTRFLGVAELLGRLDLAGGRIVEFPAELQVRVLGRSKMKILRTIAGHLGLLLRLLASRWRGATPRLARVPAGSAPSTPLPPASPPAHV